MAEPSVAVALMLERVLLELSMKAMALPSEDAWILESVLLELYASM